MSGKQPKRKERPGVDVYGRTPLLKAVIDDSEKAVRELVEAGGDVNHQDDNGWTALHFAAQERKNAVAEILLSAGADPNLTDSHGNSPLWTATMNARGDFSLIQLLLNAGAIPDRKNRHGRSPSDIASTIQGGLEKLFEQGSGGNVG